MSEKLKEEALSQDYRRGAGLMLARIESRLREIHPDDQNDASPHLLQ